MVGLTPLKLKIENIWLKGMGSIFNGWDYLCVGPTMEFLEFIIRFRVIVPLEDPNSQMVN